MCVCFLFFLVCRHKRWDIGGQVFGGVTGGIGNAMDASTLAHASIRVHHVFVRWAILDSLGHALVLLALGINNTVLPPTPTPFYFVSLSADSRCLCVVVVQWLGSQQEEDAALDELFRNKGGWPGLVSLRCPPQGGVERGTRAVAFAAVELMESFYLRRMFTAGRFGRRALASAIREAVRVFFTCLPKTQTYMYTPEYTHESQ